METLFTVTAGLSIALFVGMLLAGARGRCGLLAVATLALAGSAVVAPALAQPPHAASTVWWETGGPQVFAAAWSPSGDLLAIQLPSSILLLDGQAGAEATGS